MKSLDRKDGSEQKHSIFDALNLANERIIEAAKLLILAERGEFIVALHTLEDAVYSELHAQAELNNAVRAATLAIATQSGRHSKPAKKVVSKQLSKAA